MSSIAHPAAPMQDTRAILAKQRLRATYIEAVAEALYRADRCSPFAQLKDVPLTELKSHYHLVATAAVLMVADDELREAADYYAADCVQAFRTAPALRDLPLRTRVSLASDAHHLLRNWLRFLTGMYPAALATYRALVRSDKAAIAEQRKAAAESRKAAR